MIINFTSSYPILPRINQNISPSGKRKIAQKMIIDQKTSLWKWPKNTQIGGELYLTNSKNIIRSTTASTTFSHSKGISCAFPLCIYSERIQKNRRYDCTTKFCWLMGDRRRFSGIFIVPVTPSVNIASKVYHKYSPPPNLDSKVENTLPVYSTLYRPKAKAKTMRKSEPRRPCWAGFC